MIGGCKKFFEQEIPGAPNGTWETVGSPGFEMSVKKL